MSDERMRCQHQRLAGGKWTLKEEKPKYAPDRTCDVEHLKLELACDLPRRHLEAVCTLRLRASYGPFQSISLDAVDLEIHSVTDEQGRDLSHSYMNRKLIVRFSEPVPTGCDIVVRYTIDHPALGLYFHGPTPTEPDATWQMWSQGEDEEARYWIPCHDAPNEKMTTEMIVTTDGRYTVVSNGALLQEDTNQDGTKTWRFLESVPHTSYLITLVIGEFVRLADGWRGIPVEYFIEPGREEEARRSFGKTPRMMEFYSERFDYPYPYEKYTQVAIRHFHFGGMENTSATSQTDGTLHDERAALNITSDELVAHELVHQWFGDLLTCKSWAHAWLNEGFATYFEALWKEEDLGRSEFEYEMIANAAGYMSDPYRRSIVSNRYAYPHDLFDNHLYPKAGWVLHMLRRNLGEDLFWKAIRLYVRRYEKDCVETVDLVRSFENATGKNLTGFFDQWVMSPGHPDIEGSMAWDEDNQWVSVDLKQTQKADAGVPAIFQIAVGIECRLTDGRILRETFQMDQREQTFYVKTGEKPVWTVLDPDQAILGTWKVNRPFEWLEATLTGKTRHAAVNVRVDALRRVADKPGFKAETLLGTVLREDPFWGVQAEAAQALGKIHTNHCFELLREGVGLPDAKTRTAVVSALGNFRTPEAAQLLTSVIEKGDASYYVLGSAARSLGRTGQPGVVITIRRAVNLDSWHDVVAMMAASGLASTRDETVVDDLLAIAGDSRRYWNCRLTAMRAMAELGVARPTLSRRIAEELIPFLDDADLLVASRVAGAIVALGDDIGVAALRGAAERTPDPRRAQECLIAADELAASRKRGEDVDQLKDELEKLRGESKEIREQLRKVEEKVFPHVNGNGNFPKAKAATPSSRGAGRAKDRKGARVGPGAKSAASPKRKASKPTRPGSPVSKRRESGRK